jgi:U4/U6.U5 tri-snRNP component SNU23
VSRYLIRVLPLTFSLLLLDFPPFSLTNLPHEPPLKPLSSRPPFSNRPDLRRLGQTTKVVKSTLNDVRQKIADLRAKSAAAAEAKQYDFEQRIKEIKAAEVASKEEQREAKRRKKEEEKAAEEAKRTEGVDEDMMKMMGFGGFGGGAKA